MHRIARSLAAGRHCLKSARSALSTPLTPSIGASGLVSRPRPLSSTQSTLKTAVVPLIEYADADHEVRAIYDQMVKEFELKGPHQINNFWKVLANHYPTFKGTWDRMRVVMAPGTLDPVVKEMIYVAVSTTNGCDYCVASHTASAKKLGMTDSQLGELQAVVAMANETNRLAFGYRVAVDEMYEKLWAKSNAKKVVEREAGKKQG